MKRISGTTLVFTILFIFEFVLHAQNYQLQYRQTTEITVASGFLYDNGGPENDYRENSYDLLTIRPAVAGYHVKLQFTDFTLAYKDTLIIYNGENTSAPVIVPGRHDPFTVYSTHPSGALTLKFRSSLSSMNKGFEAIISLLDQLPDSDLEITDLVCEPNILEGSASVKISGNYRCNSTDTVYHPYIECFISPDTILDPSDKLYSVINLGPTNPGNTYSAYTYLRNNGELIAGDQYVIGRIADTNRGTDSHPGDNTKATPVHINPTEIDVSVSQLDLSPNWLNSATSNDLQFRISNNSEIPVFIRDVGLFLSEDTALSEEDVLISTVENTYLAVNGYQDIYHTLLPHPLDTLEEGVYNLLVVADYKNLCSEVDEFNNTYVKQILLTKPDSLDSKNLSLTSVSTNRDTVAANQHVIFNFKVHTNTYIPSASFRLYISQDSLLNPEFDRMMDNTSVFLGPEGDFQISSRPGFYIDESYSISTGLNYIIAEIDPEDNINETDESDNMVIIPVQIVIQSYEDLTLSDLRINCDSAFNIKPFTISCKLTNNGTGDKLSAGVGFFLSYDSVYDEGDMLIRFGSTPVLGPTFSTSIAQNLVLPEYPAGEYYLIGVANYYNYLNEKNSDDNIGVIPLKLLGPESIGPFDIELKELNSKDTLVSESECTLSFEYLIHSIDEMEISFGAYLSEDSVLNEEDLPLQLFHEVINCPGYELTTVSKEVTLPEITAPGRFFLILKVDHDNLIFGENEENNVSIKPVYIRTVPNPIVDLELKSPFLTDLVYTRGSALNALVGIQNSGTVSADTVYVEVLINGKDSAEIGTSIWKDTIYDIGRENSFFRIETPLPDSLEEGLYRVELKVTPGNHMIELNPENNTINAVIGIQPSDADFELQNAVLWEDMIPESGATTARYSLINKGATATGSPKVSCYVSTDDQFSNDDFLLASSYPQGLQIQNSVSVTQSITLPESIEPGHYYLFIIIDPENQFAETTETNNSWSGEIDVFPASRNLTIESLELNVSREFLADYLQISSTIRNTGDYKSSEYTWDCYLSQDSIIDKSDILIFSSALNSLDPDEAHLTSNNYNITNLRGADQYYIICIVDGDGQIPESNKTDNTRSADFSINRRDTELVILESTLPDTFYVSPGKNMGCVLTIGNSGTDAFMGTVYYSHFLSEDTILSPFEDTRTGTEAYNGTLSEIQYHRISPNFAVPYNIPYGTYYWIIELDANDNVIETNEENNLIVVPIKIVAPTLDLSITNLEINTDTVMMKGTIDLSYTVTNMGTSSISRYSMGEIILTRDTLLFLDKYLFELLSIPPLADSSEYHTDVTYNIPSTLPAGDYYLVLRVDQRNNLIESNETNNVKFIPIHIEEAEIDLVITHVGLRKEWDYYKFYTDIMNLGSVAPDDYCYLGYYLSTDMKYDEDDLLIGSEKMPSILTNTSYGEFSELRLPDVDPGQYYILYFIDHTDRVEEINESNNVEFYPISILGDGVIPDLTITDADFTYRTEHIDLNFNVTNSGSEDVTTSTECSVYFSDDLYVDETDRLIDTITITPVLQNESHPETIEIPLPDGYEYNRVLIVADSRDSVFEFNESNNNLLVQLLISPYDIEVELKDVESEAAPGDTIALNPTIWNSGNYPSDTMVIEYFLSLDEIVDTTDTFLYSTFTIPVQPGESRSYSHALNLPADLTPDYYYLLMIVNPYFLSNETNTGNNTSGLKSNDINPVNNLAANLIELVGPDLTGTPGMSTETEIRIFPNPVSHQLNIQAESIIKHYKIIDNQSKIVMEGNPDSPIKSIHTESLSEGIYYLVLGLDAGTRVFIFEVIR